MNLSNEYVRLVRSHHITCSAAVAVLWLVSRKLLHFMRNFSSSYRIFSRRSGENDWAKGTLPLVIRWWWIKLIIVLNCCTCASENCEMLCAAKTISRNFHFEDFFFHGAFIYQEQHPCSGWLCERWEKSTQWNFHLAQSIDKPLRYEVCASKKPCAACKVYRRNMNR